MSVLASDDFNRTNESPIAGNWTVNLQNPGSGNLDLVSNQLTRTTGGYGAAWWNPETFPADCEVLATLSTKPADGSRMEIYTRVAQPGVSAEADAYLVKYETRAGTDVWRLFRLDNNSEVGLGAGDVSQEVSVGDAISIKTTGSTIEAWYYPSGGGSTLVQSVTDTTYPDGGYAGLGTDLGGGWDNFSVEGAAVSTDFLVPRHGIGLGRW